MSTGVSIRKIPHQRILIKRFPQFRVLYSVTLSPETHRIVTDGFTVQAAQHPCHNNQGITSGICYGGADVS